MKRDILMFALASACLLGLMNAAFADSFSAIGSGYAVTTNYHGKDVPPSTLVTATAGTLDSSVNQVTFVWHKPNGSVVATHIVTAFSSNGTQAEWRKYRQLFDIRYFFDTYTPDTSGDWGVQAFFQDSGTTKASISDVVKIRATSFFVVPETLGTVGAFVVMVAALTVFAVKRKKTLTRKSKL